MHTIENSSETDTSTNLEFRNPPHILEGEVKHETNFSGEFVNIATDAKKHAVGVSLLIGKRDLMQITLILPWRYSHLQLPRSPLQAGLKADAESLRKQIQQDTHHQEKKSALIVALAHIEYLQWSFVEVSGVRMVCKILYSFILVQ